MWKEIWRDALYKVIRFEGSEVKYGVFDTDNRDPKLENVVGGSVFLTLNGAVSHVRLLESWMW